MLSLPQGDAQSEVGMEAFLEGEEGLHQSGGSEPSSLPVSWGQGWELGHGRDASWGFREPQVL